MKVFLLPKVSKNVTINEIESTDLYPKPLNSVGYNYYTIQTNDVFAKLLTEPQNVGKKFFNIIENLTIDLPNYENNIETITTKYFGESVSREFLQIWEILLTFNLIHTSISVNSESVEEQVFNKLKKYKSFTLSKSKKVSHLFFLYDIELRTSELDISMKIKKDIQKLETLEKGGHLIIKVNDLIHVPSVHLLYFLSNLFENVYIYRPDVALVSYGEKYIVCTNYNGKLIKYNTTNTYLTLNMNVPVEYIFVLNIINSMCIQEEYIMKNKMRNFIESQNYYGDEYHSHFAMQQINTDSWIANNLMLSSKDYNELVVIKEKLLKKHINEFEQFVENKTKLTV
jgi:hypothetical protein